MFFSRKSSNMGVNLVLGNTYGWFPRNGGTGPNFDQIFKLVGFLRYFTHSFLYQWCIISYEKEHEYWKLTKLQHFFRKISSKSMVMKLFLRAFRFRAVILSITVQSFLIFINVRDNSPLRSYLYLENPWRNIKIYDDVIFPIIFVVLVI